MKIDQRRVDVSTGISNVSCKEMCVCVGLSVGRSVDVFLSGCADVLFLDAELERFFDLPRLYTCTTVLYSALCSTEKKMH